MESEDTTRRRYLMAAGTTATAMLAGCQSGADSGDENSTETTTSATTESATTTAAGETETTTDDEDYPADEDPDDGYPPEFENRPEPMEFDADSFPTAREQVDGSTVEVPLVPLDVAHNLYMRREARTIDARAETGYEVSHVLGAVRSLRSGGDDDATADWPKSDRVIAYCHCPIHYSVRRAAHLIDEGFEEVYALQGGYQAWKVADYPTDGEGVPSTAKTWTIDGETDASDGGGVAYVYHSATDQVAGAEIDSDGTYSLEFAFRSVSGSDTVTVGTPSYEVEGSVKSFAGGTVADDGSTNATTNGTTANSTANGTTTNATTNGTPTNATTNGTTTNGTANGTDDNGTDANSTFGRLVGGRLW